MRGSDLMCADGLHRSVGFQRAILVWSLTQLVRNLHPVDFDTAGPNIAGEDVITHNYQT